MISQSKASELLNYLVGGTSLNSMTSVYLGICTNEPAHADGTITGEPTAESYARAPIYAMSSNVVVTDVFDTAANGVVSNVKDIQMQAAREDWGTMYYWFLSVSKTEGKAFLWGKLRNKEGVEGVTISEETVPVFYQNQLKASIDVPLD